MPKKTIASVSPKKRTVRFSPKTSTSPTSSGAKSLSSLTATASSPISPPAASPPLLVVQEPPPGPDTIMSGPWTIVFMDLEMSRRIDPQGQCILARYLALAYAQLNTGNGQMKGLAGNPLDAFKIDRVDRKTWTIYARLKTDAPTMTLGVADSNSHIEHGPREITVAAPPQMRESIYDPRESGLALI